MVLRWPIAVSDRMAIRVLLFVALVNNLLWNSAIPYNKGPDEYTHFEMAQFIYENQRLPVFGKGRDLYVWVDGSGQPVEGYALYPGLAYVPAAVAMRLVPGEPFRAARLVSLLSGIATVYLAYVVARRLFPASRLLYLGAATFVAFLPQFTFVSAYLNNDSFTAMVAGLVLYFWLRGRDDGWTLGSSLGLGAALGLVALSKYNAYIFFVFSAAVLAMTLRGSPRDVARRLAVIIGVPIVVAGWWFARNYALYGEMVPIATLDAAMRTEAPGFTRAWADAGYNAITLSTSTHFWEWTFKSFWAAFDYMSLFLEPVYYDIALVVCLLATVGLAKAFLSRAFGGNLAGPPYFQRTQMLLVFALLVLTSAGLSLLASLYRDFQAQGRYLFPALIPIAVLLVVGLRELTPSGIPRYVVFAALGGGLVALNAISLFGYIVPRYYGDGVSKVRIVIDEPRPGAVLKGQALIGGWALDEGSVRWWPWAFASPVASSGIEGVRVYLDGPPGSGALLGEATYAGPRPDVSAALGSESRFVYSGFNFLWNAGQAREGSHTLHVCAQSAVSHQSTCAAVPVQLLSSGWLGSLDSPTTGAVLSGVVNLGGWANDTLTQVERVEVYARDSNGIRYFLGPAQVNLPRPDLAGPYAWNLTWDSASLPDGTYTFGATAVAGNDRFYTWESAGVTVGNSWLGSLDFPPPGSTISGVVNIGGWAQSIFGPPVAKIEVYAIDSTNTRRLLGYLGYTEVNLPRPDLEGNYAWNRTWDSATLPDGTYTFGARASNFSGAERVWENRGVIIRNGR